MCRFYHFTWTRTILAQGNICRACSAPVGPVIALLFAAQVGMGACSIRGWTQRQTALAASVAPAHYIGNQSCAERKRFQRCRQDSSPQLPSMMWPPLAAMIFLHLPAIEPMVFTM